MVERFRVVSHGSTWVGTLDFEVDDGIVWQAEAKVVREAVAALPDRQREAVVLAYYRGRTYREVARDLSIPEGTAKWRLKAALSGLADCLAAEGILER